jgi:hypothetical protein
VELTDGYPYKVVAYFARLHRWIAETGRSFHGSDARSERRTQRSEPVSALSRFKIFDNLVGVSRPAFTSGALWE